MPDPMLLLDPPSPPLAPPELLPGTVLGLVMPRLRWHCSFCRPVIASHCALVPLLPVPAPVLGLEPMPEAPVPLPVPTLGPDVLPDPVLPPIPPEDCAIDAPERPSRAAVTAAPSTLVIMFCSF
jgi:hypothetical protein